MRRSILLLFAAGLPLAAGCIPYSTGTTAVPTPVGTMEPSMSAYFIPRGVDFEDPDSSAAPLFGVDLEARIGIDDRSDLGIRAPGFVGVVVDYKRRLDAGPHDGAAVAATFGGGVVNAGDHALVQAGLLASGRQNSGATAYGRIKAMQVIPLNSEAVSDQPTVGAFAGVRLGTQRLGISPEIGVFYDPSALDLRRSNWIVVPSFTFHGQQLLDLFFGGSRGGADPYPPRPAPVPRPPGGRWP
jgi:hypothetical protein